MGKNHKKITAAERDSKVKAFEAKMIDQESNEVKFGKNLASCDKGTRDRTVSALRVWLQKRSSKGALSDLDLAKVWRGLWYCMWMCDKTPIQQELCSVLADLTNLFVRTPEEGIRFQRHFYVTMRKDWGKLDYYRIDKFYSLVRYFVRAGLAFCFKDVQKEPLLIGSRKKKDKNAAKSNTELQNGENSHPTKQCDLELLTAFVTMLRDEVLLQLPNGLRLHITDLFITELHNAGGDAVDTSCMMTAVEPFLAVLICGGVPGQGAESKAFYTRVLERVFGELIDYLTPEPESAEDEEETEKKSFPHVDVVTLQRALFTIAGAPSTRELHRHDLYALVKRCQAITGVMGTGTNDADYDVSSIAPGSTEALRATSQQYVGKKRKHSSKDVEVNGSEQDEYSSDEEEPVYVKKRKMLQGGDRGEAVAGWAASAIENGKIVDNDDEEEEPQEEVIAEPEPEPKRKKQKKDKAKKSATELDVVTEKAPEKTKSAKKESKKDVKVKEINGKIDAVPTSVESVSEVHVAEKSKKNDLGVPVQDTTTSTKKKKKRKLSIEKEEGSHDAVVEHVPPVVSETSSENLQSQPGAKPLSEKHLASTPQSKKSKKASSESKHESSHSISLAKIDATVPVTPVHADDSSASVSSGLTIKLDTSKKSKKSKKYKSPVSTPPGAMGGAGKAGNKVAGAQSTGGLMKKKKVRFGNHQTKDYSKSIKDLKSKPATPAKASGTPVKGLLKSIASPATPANHETKLSTRTAPRAATPRHPQRKRAADFF